MAKTMTVHVGGPRPTWHQLAGELLGNVGHPSADRVIEEFQHPQLGDWVPMFSTVNDTTAFRIARLEAPHLLEWTKPDSTWAWRLSPVDGGTRLVTRLRIRYRWNRPLDALISVVLTEFGDFPTMRKMLLTIKQRAERSTLKAQERHTLDRVLAP